MLERLLDEMLYSTGCESNCNHSLFIDCAPSYDFLNDYRRASEAAILMPWHGKTQRSRADFMRKHGISYGHARKVAMVARAMKLISIAKPFEKRMSVQGFQKICGYAQSIAEL